MCFEQNSTRHPKVLFSSRIKSKRNSSRLDRHREATNCDLSLQNVAIKRLTVRKPFSSHSSEMRQPVRRAPATSDGYITYQFRKYYHPFEWLELAVQKTIVIRSKGSPELSVHKQSPTFRTARRNPLKKHKSLFVQKKKSSTVRASASRSKKIIQPSA